MARLEEQLITLTADLYEAAGEVSLYPAFTESLRSCYSGSMAFMNFAVKQQDLNWYESAQLGITSPGETFSVGANYSQENLLAYTPDWVTRDGFTDEVVGRGLTEGLLVFDRQEVRADDTFERSRFYQDFARAREFFHIVGVTGFSADRTSGFYLMLGRPKSLGPFDEQVKTSLSLLAPHFLRAQAIYLKWCHLRHEQQMHAFALDALGRACLVVDAAGNVSWLNAAAETLLSRGGGLSVRYGQLRVSAPVQHQLLLEAVRRCTVIGKDVLGSAGDTFVISRTPPAPSLFITVLPTPLGNRPPQVLLVLTEPDQRRSLPTPALLRRLYGLTPAEARVALLLAEGYAVESIAAQLHVTLGTVRNQLKQVFSKTETHRQAQLVRLVLGLT